MKYCQWKCFDMFLFLFNEKSSLVYIMAWYQRGTLNRQYVITWAIIDQYLCCHMVSLGGNNLALTGAKGYFLAVDHFVCIYKGREWMENRNGCSFQYVVLEIYHHLKLIKCSAITRNHYRNVTWLLLNCTSLVFKTIFQYSMLRWRIMCLYWRLKIVMNEIILQNERMVEECGDVHI